VLDAIRLSVGTLTAIPVPPPRRVDRRVAGAAMAMAPLAVLPLALGVLAVSAGGALVGAPPLVLAAVAVVVLVLGTRAIHLDGLADTADGLSSGDDRRRALEVMRRSDIGPSGVAAVTLVLLLDVAALTTLLATWRGGALAGVAVLSSRSLLAWACVRGVPSARSDGLGATVAGTVGASVLVVSAVAMAAFSAAAAALTGLAWWAGPTVLVAAVVAGWVVVRRAVRRVGGVTGDVLGAVVEIGLAVALTTAALVLPHAG
jgi:adenosylcobinamide-GDP ribazoletransferase